MKLLAELLFVFLVTLDLVLTYRVIKSGKGRERKYWVIFGKKFRTFTAMYIDKPILTYGITIAGVGAIFVLIELSGAFIFYIPINAVFAWACWNSWRILHG